VPYGARFRLKAGYNISGFSAQTQVVLRGMQHYGMFVTDIGSDWFITGTQDATWDSSWGQTVIQQLKSVPAAQFEAVDESSLMVDPNSGQARGAPAPTPTAKPTVKPTAKPTPSTIVVSPVAPEPVPSPSPSPSAEASPSPTPSESPVALAPTDVASPAAGAIAPAQGAARTPASNPGGWPWWAVLVVVALAGLVLFLFWRRRRALSSA
jgi:cobalamin biosynthesis Mg chelatase CobN